MQWTQKDLLDQLNCQSLVVINHAELQNLMIFISNYKKKLKVQRIFATLDQLCRADAKARQYSKNKRETGKKFNL